MSKENVLFKLKDITYVTFLMRGRSPLFLQSSFRDIKTYAVFFKKRFMHILKEKNK